MSLGDPANPGMLAGLRNAETALRPSEASEPGVFRDLNGDLHIRNDGGDMVRLTVAPPTFLRPPVEKYVRVTVESRGFTMEPAVEWREGDDFYALTDRLDAIAEAASAIGWPHPMGAAKECGKRIAAWLPDRAYFVEVWHGERKGFAQVFQPYGVPRNAP